nr:winged helix-turn-helix domain-containing protein [Salmonella enterica]
MSTINTDLIAHIYAASESPLTNDELYREVQRKTGMSDAELHELKEFGSDKTRTSGVKHKVRWFQQTLRQAGVIERVPEKRGVWRYASKTKTNLHESWEKLCVVGFSTSLGASVFGNAYAFFSNLTEQIHLCAHDVGRILSRDNQAVYVNDAGMSHFWIDKHVFIA